MTAGVLNAVDRQIIAVLKPVIEADLHWTDRDYGRLASLFQLSAALAFLFTGRIVDRLGVKWASPAGVAAWSLAAISHGWAGSFMQFAIARVALGATESMGTPSSIKTVVSLFTERQRTLAIGVFNSSSNIGAILTPLAAPLIATVYGWRSTFVVVGAVGFVWVVIWLLVSARWTQAPIAPPSPAGPPRAPALAPRGWRLLSGRFQDSILRDRRTWAIAVAKTLSDQAWWLLLFWAPDFFHRVFGLGVTQMAAPLAVIYGCAAAGSMIAGVVSTRLLSAGFSLNATRKGALLVAALLITSAPLALYARNYWLAVELIGLVLAAHQVFAVNVFAMITDIIPADRVGRVTSFGALCGNLGGMTILFVAGEVLAGGYGYGPLFAIIAVSYLLAVGWIQLLLPKLQAV